MVHPAEPFDELIRCFDETGKEIEPHARAEVHEKPLKYWHGVTAVVLVSPKGEILCSKRSELLSQRPGLWQTNFGGHVNVGKTFEENAISELASESGVIKTQSDLYFLDEFWNHEFKHLGKYYTCLFTGDISDLKFSDGEITEVKWMDMQEAWQEKLSNPDKWAGGCQPDRQKKIKTWLKTQI